MKSSFNAINIFIFFIIISFGKVISLLDFTYPSAIGLTNRNVFIVEKKGIYVYNEEINSVIYSYPFQEEGDQINDENSLSNVVIKLKNNYIICLINRKIFFFDYEGKFILETGRIITDENYYYPSLTPISLNEENFYFYVISYFIYDSGSYKQNVLYYKINLYDKTNNYITQKTLNRFESKSWGGLSSDTYDFNCMGLSCEYMQSENKDEYNYLVCFLIINKDNSLSLSLNYFEIASNSLTTNKQFKAAYLDNINQVKQIQSVVKNNRKNSLVCLLFTNNDLKCYKFRYVYSLLSDTVEFYGETSTNFNCRNSLYGMKLNYLADGQKITLSCINSYSTVQAKFFNSDLDLSSSTIFQQFTQCTSIYGHSIIQNNNSTYYIISDVICDNYKRCYEPLVGDLSPIIIITTTQKVENEFEEEEKIEEELEETKEEIKEEKENIEEIYEEIEEETREEMVEEEITQIKKQKFDCSNLEKCKECDQESFDKNLCISCNNEKNYYYLNNYSSEPRNKYINCINEINKPSKFYFNKINSDYEPCYTTCASCEYGGNFKENNCTSCDEVYYIKNPEDENSSNCVIKCKYFYYIENDAYTCTEIPFCPEAYNYMIKEKSKCTNDCKEDKEYKYRYNGECFKECPNNTKDDNDFICKDIQTNKCQLTESDINLINENITYDEVEKLVIKYINEYNYTDDHVSLYKNGDYTITIYIKSKCILELELGIPEIDFGSCYEKVLNNYGANIEELIIAIIDKIIDSKNTKKVLKFGMFSPLTGKYINSDELCQEDKITIIDNIENKLSEAKVDLQIIKEFVNEGIDIFNMSSPFYNDICFQYNSKKDVPLKDRILEYFPNITLCEEGCDLIGINMTTITSICECYYSDEKREENLKDKVLEEAQISFIEEILSSSNLYVIKCINLVVKAETFKKGYGGFIILGLFLIEILCALIYFKKNLYSITKYIFIITNKYISYLLKKNSNKLEYKNKIKNKPNIIPFENTNKNNAPPKLNSQKERKSIDIIRPNVRKNRPKSKSERKKEINRNINFIINNNKNSKIKNNYDLNGPNPVNNNINNNNMKRPKKNGLSFYKTKNNSIDFSNLSDKDMFSEQKFQINKSFNGLFPNINDNLDININEYLETQYDEMDYDESIRKDHRKFCECYAEKLRDNQIIINTFWSDEAIRPKSIKIIFLILQIDLYFFINGLFYDEEYISKIYHLEKDTFFTMADRFFDNLIYAALAGIVINYIIEFFFIEELKIKKILKMEKDNILILKYEMIKIIKSIKTRYLLFIIISFIISLVSLVHIFCFNIVYYHTMKEWIGFSLIIILSIQIGSFLICFLQTALRFISFKFKSEKLFKLSMM